MSKKNLAGDEAGRPAIRVVADDRYWDRSDLERFHIQEFLTEHEKEGKRPIIRFVLRDNKAVTGLFVELGIYAYVIDAKVGERVRRVIVPKHAIDYVILGEEQ